METPMTSPMAPPSDLPPNHPLQLSPPDLPQTVQILPITTTPSPPNKLEQLVSAYLTEHPPDTDDNESTDTPLLPLSSLSNLSTGLKRTPSMSTSYPPL